MSKTIVFLIVSALIGGFFAFLGALSAGIELRYTINRIITYALIFPIFSFMFFKLIKKHFTAVLLKTNESKNSSSKESANAAKEKDSSANKAEKAPGEPIAENSEPKDDPVIIDSITRDKQLKFGGQSLIGEDEYGEKRQNAIGADFSDFAISKNASVQDRIGEEDPKVIAKAVQHLLKKDEIE